ncbi:GNAT family N-acetyltransferase [Pedobacter borealis]|uniref:GNAT family N-acetyltransferase n=1 Tax=Pedobacter borealis TaxID=475254 RepID=UPI00049310AF|nr:GNAT family N-acetyltransferase [Pedobacter borealis]
MSNRQIEYSFERIPTLEQIIELYDNSGLPRPIADRARIETMYKNSNLIITAWDNEKLVGISRSLTDWVWCCYLADLAVSPDYKKSGIAKKMIELTKQKVSEKSIVLLLSVPTALEYYPKVGMDKVENGFIIHRSE